MGETCAVCGVALARSDVMYAPDGSIVCAKHPDGPKAKPRPVPAWQTWGITGGVVGGIPFVVTVSSTSSTVVNGEVTNFVYRDWIAVGCGVAAIMLGIITTNFARKEDLRRGLAFAAGIGVIVLGAIQIARGFGVFATPG